MDAPFLGVERSLLGKIWRTRGGDERAALTLSQRLDLPEIVGRILAARGVGVDEAPAFLAPTLIDDSLRYWKAFSRLSLRE